MNRFLRGLIPLLLVLLVAGCNSKPSEETVRMQVTDNLTQEYGDAVFDIINFKKVNGIPRDNNTYIAEVEYDLRFKVDLQDAAEALQPQSKNIIDAGMKAAALGIKYGDFKAGDLRHKKERVRFVRAESGWIIDEKEE